MDNHKLGPRKSRCAVGAGMTTPYTLPEPALLPFYDSRNSFYTADQMHAAFAAGAASRDAEIEAVRKANINCVDYFNALKVDFDKLAAEIEAMRKGEFICQKCGLRKDSEHCTNHDF